MRKFTFVYAWVKKEFQTVQFHRVCSRLNLLIAPCVLGTLFAVLLGLPTTVGVSVVGMDLQPRRADAPVASSAVAAPNYVESASTLRHWEKRVVHVRLAGPEEGRTLEETSAILDRGLALWNAKMGGMVNLEQTTDSEADITMNFVCPHTLPGRAIGRTDVTYRLADQILIRAQVSIDNGLSEAQLLQVMAHEMGHALGIQGHSPDKNDLMFPYAHTPAVITERDLNTMFVSYGIAPRTSVEAQVSTASPSQSVSAASLPAVVEQKP